MEEMDIELAKQIRISELQDLHKDYRWLFIRQGSLRRARRVLDHLNKSCFMEDITFTPDEPAPEISMAFREGRRSVTLHIKHMLEPENFTEETLIKKMTEEYYGLD